MMLRQACGQMAGEGLLTAHSATPLMLRWACCREQEEEGGGGGQ